MTKTVFSEVKQTNFYAVPLLLLTDKQPAALPLLTQVWLKDANVHGLVALKEIKDEFPTRSNLIGDLA